MRDAGTHATKRNATSESNVIPLTRRHGNIPMLGAEIVGEGEAAIANLIAAEAKSECPNKDAIRLTKDLLIELEDLSAEGVRFGSHAVLASGVGATLQLIALQAAKSAPNFHAIEHAAWLCAYIADLLDTELDRRAQ